MNKVIYHRRKPARYVSVYTTKRQRREMLKNVLFWCSFGFICLTMIYMGN